MPTPVRFVLVHPRTPANLGAAARALKNFGQGEWTWVRPPWSPDDARARTLAVGAEDVLASAWIAETLEEAVADCSWVVGTSGRARLRTAPLDPEAFAAEAARRPGRVALVFGDERTGLGETNSPAATPYPHPLRRAAALVEPRPGALPVRLLAVPWTAAELRTTPPAEQRCRPPPAGDRPRRRPARVRFVRPGRAGVGPRWSPWRRSGLTGIEARLWESSHPHARPVAEQSPSSFQGLDPTRTAERGPQWSGSRPPPGLVKVNPRRDPRPCHSPGSAGPADPVGDAGAARADAAGGTHAAAGGDSAPDPRLSRAASSRTRVTALSPRCARSARRSSALASRTSGSSSRGRTSSGSSTSSTRSSAPGASTCARSATCPTSGAARPACRSSASRSTWPTRRSSRSRASWAAAWSPSARS